MDDVIFAFLPHFTGFFCALFTFTGNIIVKGNDFGTDKPFFKIGMDRTGGFRRFCNTADRPGSPSFELGGTGTESEAFTL